jgi:hypothetical protein
MVHIAWSKLIKFGTYPPAPQHHRRGGDQECGNRFAYHQKLQFGCHPDRDATMPLPQPPRIPHLGRDNMMQSGFSARKPLNPCDSRTNQRNRDAMVRLARISRFVTHYIVLLTNKRKSRTRFPAQPGLGYFLAPAAICILTILSGAVTAPLSSFAPFLILSTTSMPPMTWPTTVYL